ncbi:MAG: DUF1211 domain-containing protein [Acidobacteriales bacterium]|nr:DUF1211 domain-containing protein [Terriglobales bacterium]
MGHHAILPEKDFRWRAGEITRLEAFCDIVFGFAITLLVVSLEVPRDYAELMADLRGFVPFAICFSQLILIWYNHYRFSRRFGLEDTYTVFLNVVLVFLVLFYVYPLKFLFTGLFAQLSGTTGPLDHSTLHEASVLMRVYAIGFAAVFGLFVLMYRHAYKLRDQLQLTPLERLITRTAIQENLGMVGVGLLSFLLAFRHPAAAGWIYSGIGIFFWIHGSITGKRMRLLRESQSPAGEEYSRH